MALQQRTENSKMNIAIQIDMSALFVDYALSRKPTKMHLANLRQFINALDLEVYKKNYDVYNNLYLTKLIVDAKTNKGLSKPSLIKLDILNTEPLLSDMVNTYNWEEDTLTGSECRRIAQWVDEHMQYYFIYMEMPKIIEAWEK